MCERIKLVRFSLGGLLVVVVDSVRVVEKFACDQVLCWFAEPNVVRFLNVRATRNTVRTLCANLASVWDSIVG